MLNFKKGFCMQQDTPGHAPKAGSVWFPGHPHGGNKILDH